MAINLELVETYDLLWEHQRRIIKVYHQQGLKNISGLHNEYELNGRNLIAWYFEVTGKNKKINSDFDYFKNIDDIKLASDELLFFTANLFLYRPYINNPLVDSEYFSGEMVYINNQNMEGARYDMFTDIVAQQVYNFWSRITELINSFFPDPKSRIYFFPTLIDTIPEQYTGNANYVWLKNFRDIEYVELNNIRKMIVHYSSVGTGFRHEHSMNVRNREEMEKIVDKRNNWADFFKKHIMLTIDGLEQTLLFLEHVNSDRQENIP